MLSNGAFDTGLVAWMTRSGALRFAKATYAGAPGAALLITSLTTADGGKVAVAGQCVDLAEVPGLGRAELPGQAIAVDAYLLAMPETESVSLSAVFHSGAGCRGDVIDVAGPPGVAGGGGWTRVTQVITVPPRTAAIDFVVRAVSQSGAGRALVDAVCAYPSLTSD